MSIADRSLGSRDLVTALKLRGIAASPLPPYRMRFTTHRLVGEREADTLVAALQDILDG
jgi:hypothetical protein